MKIVVYDIPPSNNQFLGNSNSFRIYGREKKKWFRHIANRIPVQDIPKEPIKRALIRITYYFPDRRRRDPDNYSGKFLLDPLVKLKIIEDDSFNNVTLELHGNYDKSNPRVEIEIFNLMG